MEPILSTGASAPSLPLALDHLVVAAATLDEGEAWLRRRLGTGLAPGGSHAGYGTHNRLLRLGSEHYLELIAPDPAQSGADRKLSGTTLFGLDQPAVTEALAGGPRLVHLVFRVLKPGSLAAVLPRLRYDPGPIVRMTRDDLAWDITVAPAGRLAGYGLLPTLIDWGDTPHPCSRLPDSGLTLESVRIQGPDFVVAAFPPVPALSAADPSATAETAETAEAAETAGTGESGESGKSGKSGGRPAAGDRHARITLAAAPTAEISAGLRRGERRIIIQSALSIRELAR